MQEVSEFKAEPRVRQGLVGKTQVIFVCFQFLLEAKGGY